MNLKQVRGLLSIELINDYKLECRANILYTCEDEDVDCIVDFLLCK